jgi:pimeloyl-ACP methyl ester carboxylesterase
LGAPGRADTSTLKGANAMSDAGYPVVFIHGLWLHATSWQPWIELFEQSGYQAVAPGWPGEPDTVAEARADPAAVAGYDIDAVVARFAAAAAAFDRRPVLIGHSFGGMIAQKMLGQDLGAAAVAIDAAQFKGVLPLPLSSLRATLPVFRNPANRNRAVPLTAAQFRYSFGNALPPAESDALWDRWMIPAPGRPLFQAAAANVAPRTQSSVDTANSGRGPLLLVTGGRDHTVPPVITRSTLKRYRRATAVTDLKEFPDRGHSLTVDSGWREVADACLAWLRAHGFPPA